MLFFTHEITILVFYLAGLVTVYFYHSECSFVWCCFLLLIVQKRNKKVRLPFWTLNTRKHHQTKLHYITVIKIHCYKPSYKTNQNRYCSFMKLTLSLFSFEKPVPLLQFLRCTSRSYVQFTQLMCRTFRWDILIVLYRIIKYRVSQEEWTKLRESVPYVELYRYNPKHLHPKLNGYGDNGHRKVWASGVSTYCTPSLTPYSYTAHARQRDTTS